MILKATGGALHLFIGSLADWTSTIAPLLGREETAALCIWMAANAVWAGRQLKTEEVK